MLAAALLLAFALEGAPRAARTIAARVRLAAAARGETAADARRRCLGAWAEGADAAARVIPPGADYLAAETLQNGASYFLRYDLAPRRAWYLGVPDTREALLAYGRPEGAPPWVVVTFGLGEPPRLMTAEAFFLGVPPR